MSEYTPDNLNELEQQEAAAAQGAGVNELHPSVEGEVYSGISPVQQLHHFTNIALPKTPEEIKAALTRLRHEQHWTARITPEERANSQQVRGCR